MARWKSIDAAPKDGTHIIAGYWYDYNDQMDGEPDWGWVTEVVFLMKRKGILNGYHDYHTHDVRNGEMLLAMFTHYMPLPAPPKTPEKTK